MVLFCCRSVEPRVPISGFNLSAIGMLSAIAANTLSARVMLAPTDALYSVGREHTRQHSRPAPSRPTACSLPQQLVQFPRQMNGLLAEMSLPQPCLRCPPSPKHAPGREDARPPSMPSLHRPRQCTTRLSPDSSCRPSGCFLHHSKHSIGQEDVKALSIIHQHFKERSAKLLIFVAYSPKKGLLTANLTDFLTICCQFLLQNAHFFGDSYK